MEQKERKLGESPKKEKKDDDMKQNFAFLISDAAQLGALDTSSFIYLDLKGGEEKAEKKIGKEDKIENEIRLFDEQRKDEGTAKSEHTRGAATFGAKCGLLSGLFTEVNENIVQGVLEENGGSMLKSVMQLWDIKNSTITPNAAEKEQEQEKVREDKENLLQSFAIVDTKMEEEASVCRSTFQKSSTSNKYTIAVNWSFEPALASSVAKAWIGMFHSADTSHTKPLIYKSIPGIQSGVIDFELPSKLSLGRYEFRLFSQKYKHTATSNSFEYGIVLKKLKAELVDQNVVVQWKKRKARPEAGRLEPVDRSCKHDWIAMYHIKNSSKRSSKTPKDASNPDSAEAAASSVPEMSDLFVKKYTTYKYANSAGIVVFDRPPPGRCFFRYFFSGDKYEAFVKTSNVIEIQGKDDLGSAAFAFRSPASKQQERLKVVVPPPRSKSEEQIKQEDYKKAMKILLNATVEGSHVGDILTKETRKSINKIRRFEQMPLELHQKILSELGWPEQRYEKAKQKGKYVHHLKKILSRFAVTPEEEAFLGELRVLYAISEIEHQRCLEKAGFDVEQYELFKRNGNKSRPTNEDVLALVANELREIRLNQHLIKQNIDVKYNNLVDKLDSKFEAQARLIRNLEDIKTPRLFLIFPARKETWSSWLFDNGAWSKDAFILRLVCESHPHLHFDDQNGHDLHNDKNGSNPECWHLTDHPGYVIEEPKLFLKKYSYYFITMSRMASTIQGIVPFAGMLNWKGTLNKVLPVSDVWDRTALGPMNHFYQSIATILEDEQRDKVNTEREIVEATGANLRELSSYLMKLDPSGNYGGLLRVVDAEGGIYWMCPQCKERYAQTHNVLH